MPLPLRANEQMLSAKWAGAAIRHDSVEGLRFNVNRFLIDEELTARFCDRIK